MHLEPPTKETKEGEEGQEAATTEQTPEGACLSEEEALALMESRQILVCGQS